MSKSLQLLIGLSLIAAGTSIMVYGVQGALSVLPEIISNLENKQACLELYEELASSPDIWNIVNNIKLAQTNLEAAKSLSNLSGLGEIQSQTLVKYCVYKNIPSLGGIDLHMSNVTLNPNT